MSARFRANPARVRVGVRPMTDGWLATVATRKGAPHEVRRTAATPCEAVDAALDAADAAGMDGVDLGMGWVYPHPFKEDES